MNNQELTELLSWQVMSSRRTSNQARDCQQDDLMLSTGQTATIYHNDDIPNIAFTHQGGVYHGIYAQLYDGELSQLTHYVDGLEHGQSQQYQDGKLIGVYTLEMGTGIDLWFDAPNVLSEERHMMHGKIHGPERWWDGSNKTIWHETYHHANQRHGIERLWKIGDDNTTFQTGYPKFWVHDEQVTKEAYERACLTDTTLAPYHQSDNHPARPLPSW